LSELQLIHAIKHLLNPSTALQRVLLEILLGNSLALQDLLELTVLMLQSGNSFTLELIIQL